MTDQSNPSSGPYYRSVRTSAGPRRRYIGSLLRPEVRAVERIRRLEQAFKAAERETKQDEMQRARLADEAIHLLVELGKRWTRLAARGGMLHQLRVGFNDPASETFVQPTVVSPNRLRAFVKARHAEPSRAQPAQSLLRLEENDRMNIDQTFDFIGLTRKLVVDALAGDNRSVREAAETNVDWVLSQLKHEHCSDPVEQMLVNTMVVSYLNSMRAFALQAQAAETQKEESFRQQMAARSQKAHAAAAAALQTHRQRIAEVPPSETPSERG